MSILGFELRSLIPGSIRRAPFTVLLAADKVGVLDFKITLFGLRSNFTEIPTTIFNSVVKSSLLDLLSGEIRTSPFCYGGIQVHLLTKLS